MTADRDVKMRPAHHTPSGHFRNPPGSHHSRVTRAEYFRFVWRMLRESRILHPLPDGHVLPEQQALAGWQAAAGGAALMWLGHAAFLLRLGGRTLLLDPYLGAEAGPVRGLSPRRYAPPGLSVGALPALDAMVVSHNHYDHLCAKTMAQMPGRRELPVVVPLKLGDWFRRRGFGRIFELDWHDRVEIGGVTVTALPAIHWSKRTPFDANRSLWAGFAFEAKGLRVFFAGDTGYGPVFAEIGERYGPFDYALVPIGAYEPRSIMLGHHTDPEEAVRLGRDLKARRLVAMHWGTVMLTHEPPFEPPGRFHAAAAGAGYAPDDAWVMRIGETRALEPWPRNY